MKDKILYIVSAIATTIILYFFIKYPNPEITTKAPVAHYILIVCVGIMGYIPFFMGVVFRKNRK